MMALPLLLGLYLIFRSPPHESGAPKGIKAPVYEEVYALHSSLHNTVRKIDRTIYESLYRIGTSERDVVFPDVQPRHENGEVWEYTEILVHCRDKPSARALYKSLIQNLRALGKSISLKETTGFKDQFICRVLVGNKLTHKVALAFAEKKMPYADRRPRVAIIIDDMGYDIEIARAFFELTLPFSFSFLPKGPFTEKTVGEIRQRGCDIMLHLPMEPKNYPSVDPGPGALMLSMNEQEMRNTIEQDLKDVPGAKGVNNHMGSSFTENREKMVTVLKALKEKELFFVDSRTTANTVALKLARQMGVSATRRHVFLDNNRDVEAMRYQMERLIGMSRQKGAAVGIAHPHEETLHILKKFRHILENEVHLVPVSTLVH